MMWSENLLTHIEEIDKQHKVLFDCLSRLEEAHNKNDRWSQMHFAIIEMKNFAKIHFAVEESILRICDYPLLAPHIAEHRGFEDCLTHIEKRSLSEDVCDDMIKFLRRWLVEHIGKTDHQYVPFIKCAQIQLGNA